MLAKLRDKGFEIEQWNHADVILQHVLSGCEREVEEALLGLKITMSDLIEGGGGLSSIVDRLRSKLEGLKWHKKRILVISRALDVTKKPKKPKKAKKESAPIKEVKEESALIKEVEKPVHEIDHTKNFGGALVGLEIEWNSKDSVFYRDLSNLGFLYMERLLTLAIIITRGESLQEALPGFIKKFAQDEGIKSVQDIREKNLYKISDKAAKKINKLVKTGLDFSDVWAKQFVQSKFGTTTTHVGKLKKQIDRGVGGLLPIILIGIPRSVVIFKDAIRDTSHAVPHSSQRV